MLRAEGSPTPTHDVSGEGTDEHSSDQPGDDATGDGQPLHPRGLLVHPNDCLLNGRQSCRLHDRLGGAPDLPCKLVQVSEIISE